MANNKRKIIRRMRSLDDPLQVESIEDINGNTEQAIAEIVTSFDSGSEVNFIEEQSNQDGITLEKYTVLDSHVKDLNSALNRAANVALMGEKPRLIGLFGLNYDVVIGNAYLYNSMKFHYLGNCYYSHQEFRDVYELISASIMNDIRKNRENGKLSSVNKNKIHEIYSLLSESLYHSENSYLTSIEKLKNEYRNSKRGEVFNRIFRELKEVYNMSYGEKFLIVIDVADDSFDYRLLKYLNNISSPDLIIVVTYMFDIDIAASMINKSIEYCNAKNVMYYFNKFFSYGYIIRCDN